MSAKMQKKSKGINSSRNKETDLVKASGKDLVNLNEVYENVLLECEAVIIELWKTAQIVTIETNFKLGEAISGVKEYLPTTELIEKLSKDLKMSTRKLWYAVKFFELFKTWEAVEEKIDNNTTWKGMIAEYLTEGGVDTKKKKIGGGHIKLVDDLKDVLDNARRFKYHVEYSKVENPKKELVEDLNSVIKNVNRGDYE